MNEQFHHVLAAFVPMDRRRALVQGGELPDRAQGAALFADISGFTQLTRLLAQELGRKAGAEEVLNRINPVYDALIGRLHHFGGSVIGFAGDAITCWFDEQTPAGVQLPPAALRAIACGLAMQAAMTPLRTILTPARRSLTLGVKVAVAAGPTRRFLVGDPALGLMETLAGATLERMVRAEKRAVAGEVVISREAAVAAGEQLTIAEWRDDFAVIAALADPVWLAAPWPAVPVAALPVDEIQSWLLPAVFARLQGGATGLGDLRPVSPLFLRFSGIDYDGDDGAGERLDAFIRRAQQIIDYYDGSFIQLTIGDKGAFLYAAFGAPVAHEDDPKRALRAALALQQLPEKLPFIEPLQIGSSRGEVWTGTCGAAVRHTYGVMGNDVNLSARLMMVAQPGQTAVSSAMFQPADFNFAALGERSYKGFARPIPTYMLLSQKVVPERVFREKMVGRKEELGRLLEFSRPLLGSSKGEVDFALVRTAVIYGEAGVGKSRLTYALRQALSGESGTPTPFSWFTAQADQVMDRPFNAFGYWLARYFRQSSQATARENEQQFDDRLARLLAAIERLPAGATHRAALSQARSFLGALLGLHWPGSLYEQLEARDRYQNTLVALKSLVLAESELQPVILEIEDAHWLDDASLQLLSNLSHSRADRPLLILINSRYDDTGRRPSFSLDPEMPRLEIDLNVLSPAALQHLAEDLLQAPLADELQALLADKSQANPFFAQQMLLYLQEQQAITLTPSGRWTLAEPAQAAAAQLPNTLNTILVARLDRLSQKIKEVVQSAAVLGREFEIRLLDQIVQGDITAEVRQVQKEQIWNALDRWRYLFKHALLRDAAYEMQLRSRLRALHRLAALAYEQLFREDLRPYYAELAYHYDQAQDPEPAYRYARLAGDQAAGQLANHQAVVLYRRAVELAEAQQFGSPAERFDLHAALFAQYELLGEPDRLAAEVTAMEVLQADLDPPRRVRTLTYRGILEGRLGEQSELLSIFDQAINLAQQHGDQPGLNYARTQKGYAYFGMGDYENGKAMLQLVIDQAGVEGWADAARAAQIMGWIVYDEGDYDGCERYWEQSLAIFQAHEHKAGEALVLANLGTLYDTLYQSRRAVEFGERALALARRYGYREKEREALRTLGEIFANAGQYDQAWTYSSAALELAESLGSDLYGQMYVRRDLVEIILRRGGDLTQAEPLIEQSLALVRSVESKDTLGYILHTYGRFQQRLGHDEAAEAAYLESLAVRRELKEIENFLPSLTDLIALYLQMGRLAEAETAVAELSALIFPEGQPPRRDAAAGLACHHFFEMTDQPEQAAQFLNYAYESLLWRAARAGSPELRRSLLENVRSHKEIMRRWEESRSG